VEFAKEPDMNSIQTIDSSGKKSYIKPQLVIYGDLRKLTQSGAGSKKEGSTTKGGTFKICVPDAVKDRC